MATLTTTITEELTLNGQPINSVNAYSISNVNYVDKRIVSVPTSSQVTLLNFGTSVSAGTVIRANVRYIRITNTDTTNFIRIRFSKSGADTFDKKISPGGSEIFTNAVLSATATDSAFSAFVNADSISAQADTAAVNIEMYVATV